MPPRRRETSAASAARFLKERAKNPPPVKVGRRPVKIRSTRAPLSDTTARVTLHLSYNGERRTLCELAVYNFNYATASMLHAIYNRPDMTRDRLDLPHLLRVAEQMLAVALDDSRRDLERLAAIPGPE